MSLSFPQLEAVRTVSKRVIVAAGAGSGKTRVLTERIKYLIDSGVPADEIYAITYTNMAAQEMLDRLYGVSVFAGTLHSLANKILLSNGYDTSKIIQEEAFGKLLEIFETQEAGEIFLPKITHLLVDEFQDICDDECSFVLYALEAENIFLVGDSCQSIYGFKGANYRHFINLINDKETMVYTLADNYRNGYRILQHAQQYLYDMGDVYKVMSIPKRQVAGEVSHITLSYDSMYAYLQEKKDYGDWFILCRTNRQVEDTINFLKNKKIPCDTFKKSEKSFAEMNELLKSNTVKVLTIHSSKGLESKNVMTVGMRQFNSEEKRIAYVACTRARDRLIIFKDYQNYNQRGKRRQAKLFEQESPSSIMRWD